MKSDNKEIYELLRQKADYQAKLNLLPYDGSPEIKEIGGRAYIYIRKRVGSRLTSTYVDVFSEQLYQLLLKNSVEAKDLRRNIRHIEKLLAKLEYSDNDISPRVQLNLDFARVNMKSNIYDQAILEGVATSFPQTESIIEGGLVNEMTASDVQKILNLKHAWEFILDRDVILCPSDFSILCHIAKIVNEGFFYDGGRIRQVPVTIGGTSYIPPIPTEQQVKEAILDILTEKLSPEEKAIKLCLYCMKAQIFNDGNKRATVIFSNHYLISQGKGVMVIPEKEVPQFKKLLIMFYEGKDSEKITDFMKTKCLKTF